MPDSLQSVRDALAGRYAVVQPLGHGSMASVFLAEPVGGGSPVAVKVLRRELAVGLGPERFQREIGILSRLGHAHIVPLLDSDAIGGFFYLVMPTSTARTCARGCSATARCRSARCGPSRGMWPRPSTTPIVRTCSTVTSSRRTSCWRETARWSATSGWPARSTGRRWTPRRADWCWARPPT